eukprot:257965-Prymnesium_polylepis.1
MEQITAIQELVDEHKQEMPTGVATALMQKCQEAYTTMSKLYKVSCAIVGNDKDDNLNHETQTFLVEAVDAPEYYTEYENDGTVRHRISHGKMPYHGLMPEKWLQKSRPFVVESEDIHGNTKLMVIGSILPYKKRPRVEM